MELIGVSVRTLLTWMIILASRLLTPTMLKASLVLAAICLSTSALPTSSDTRSQLDTYGRAVDFSSQVPVSQLQCLKQNGYSVVFLRGFAADGDGHYDINVIGTAHNAVRIPLGVEFYMEPQPSSLTKNATQQFNEMIEALFHYGIHFRSFWLQSTWNASPQYNINFIDAILSIAQRDGFTVGIYTNQDEWKQITNNWIPNYPNLPLWYSSVKGNGAQGETSPDYNDFVPFGPFTAPTAKQFGVGESDCQIANNRDIYTNNAATPLGLVQIGESKNGVFQGN
ncbi:unnamed protein product [Caenorhabditis auriculariae]|uniref:Lysozyme n=1 Tax=Caenorhabditis auriculariae TaxID=2777116 RepID=A0A8S1H9C1_9PELO|nr:unnamed protein product [Caenorhabditis auriculariae]